MYKSAKRMFAWGCNVWGESSCPSLAAFPENKNLMGCPGDYDERVRAFLGEREDTQGEVEESIAREKWLDVLHEWEIKYPNSIITKEHREVAEKLGWLTNANREKDT